MLSEEEEKELNAKYDSIADEYMKKEMQKPPEKRGDAENLSMVFTYKKTANLVKLSENLVKHSRALTIWTIVIAISTILLFLSAVITLIERLCNL